MRSLLICAVLTATLVSPAFGHTDVGHLNSFASGIAHPLGGLDHMVTMLAVGLWSVLAGGRAIWVWPIAFVTAMLAGFAAASLGFQASIVEPAICASIVVLGLCTALAVKAPVWLGTAVVGLFALFHGHAHGTEAMAASVIPFAAGFALATAGLHTVGIGVGLFVQASIGKIALRAAGAFTVFSGLALVAG
jgi:urease accessory protein